MRRIRSSALVTKLTGSGSTPVAPTQFSKAKLTPWKAVSTSQRNPWAAALTAALPAVKLVRSHAMMRLVMTMSATGRQWIRCRSEEKSQARLMKTRMPTASMTTYMVTDLLVRGG